MKRPVVTNTLTGGDLQKGFAMQKGFAISQCGLRESVLAGVATSR